MNFDGKWMSGEAMHQWELYSYSLETEIRQCRDEGKNVDKYAALAEEIMKLPIDDTREDFADVLFKALLKEPVRADFPYVEPDELEAIRAARPAKREAFAKPAKDAALLDKLEGAWLGRVCGCLLGKPVEGWKSKEIRELAEAQGNWPLQDYLRKDEAMIEKLGRGKGGAWIDTIGGIAPIDDDTNYTALAAVGIVGRKGRDFTAKDVAEAWMAYMPKTAFCTAERRAFRNFVIGIFPPKSAIYKNPDREFIGAQIRGDYFGYINPGDPETAADMAWRDACISHVKNGIYGEMFISAVLAAAAVTDDVRRALEAGLAQIPENCRLSAKIRELFARFDAGETREDCAAWIHAEYDEYNAYDWVHTISNAVIVAYALLYGEKDYGRSICMAVSEGFDTDCNGATVGSILGMMLGTKGVPEMWSAPIGGKLRTSIAGATEVTLTELAKMTMGHIQ